MRQLISPLRSASFRYAGGLRKPPLVIQRSSSSLQRFPSTAVCPTCDLGSSEKDMGTIEKQLGDLVIDMKTPLRGLVPRHRIHLAISTGRSDWESNIELEPGTLAQGVKSLIGKGGRYSNPFWNVLVTNTSLPSAQHRVKPDLPRYSSATIYPFGLHFPYIPHTPTAVESFVKGYLSETDNELDTLRLANAHAGSFTHEVSSLFDIEPSQAVEVDHTTAVFACGHGKRDMRCGVIGPLVLEAIENAIKKDINDNSTFKNAKTGLLTHISGHKFAGNLIIFLSPTHPIALAVNSREGASTGCKNNMVGIWYGRVGPQHAQGIVDETSQGRVTEDLLRGIVAGDGGII